LHLLLDKTFGLSIAPDVTTMARNSRERAERADFALTAVGNYLDALIRLEFDVLLRGAERECINAGPHGHRVPTVCSFPLGVFVIFMRMLPKVGERLFVPA
jgi:hypothetical protein